MSPSRTNLRLILLFLVLLSAGCFVALEAKYNAMIKTCLKQIPQAREFKMFFPSAYVTISNFAGSPGTQTLTLRTQLHDRYELIMKTDLVFDKERTMLLKHGVPMFVFLEIESVGKIEFGKTQVSFNSDSQRRFGIKEWKKVAAANGDLSVLGITVITNQPIRGFTEYWKTQNPN
jgi:hypothetical protein